MGLQERQRHAIGAAVKYKTKGEAMALVDLQPDSPESLEMFTPAKRAFYVQQIGEALAVGLLRDVQLYARTVQVPGLTNKRRAIFDSARDSMLNAYVKLFQLDKQQQLGDGWRAKQASVIDVPSNVTLVGAPKPAA